MQPELFKCIELAEAIAKAARKADVSNVPSELPVAGRPISEPARTVAQIVLNTFLNYRPNDNFEVPNGARGAAPLLRDIFRLLGIKANPRSALDAALKERRAKKERAASTKLKPSNKKASSGSSLEYGIKATHPKT
jgi:hypothetical protein